MRWDIYIKYLIWVNLLDNILLLVLLNIDLLIYIVWAWYLFNWILFYDWRPVSLIPINTDWL